jgi:hypothetical protein
MSISWAPPVGPGDSSNIVFFADPLPGDPGFEDMPVQPICLHCLMEDGDEQLVRGLDLARRLGHADWGPECEKWFVPDDAVGDKA